MITVNLLQDGTSTKMGTFSKTFTRTEFGTSAGTVVGAPIFKRVGINVMIMLLGPIGIIYYEHYNISILKGLVAKSQVELQDFQAQLTTKKGEVAASAALKDKAKELANKIGILTKLSKLRLREVKSLDFIQSSIPEKVWIKEITFKENKEAKKDVQGKEELQIRGSAMTDDDLTQFIKSMENSAYFSGVLLAQAREERTKEGSVKSFEINCTVETAD